MKTNMHVCQLTVPDLITEHFMYTLFSGRDIFSWVWSRHASVVCKNGLCIVQVNVCCNEKHHFPLLQWRCRLKGQKPYQEVCVSKRNKMPSVLSHKRLKNPTGRIQTTETSWLFTSVTELLKGLPRNNST